MQTLLRCFYRVKLVVKPIIRSHFSHFQGLETVLCLVCVLTFLKFIKEFFSDGDCVCCIKRDKGNRYTRMNNLRQRLLVKIKSYPNLTLHISLSIQTLNIMLKWLLLLLT